MTTAGRRSDYDAFLALDAELRPSEVSAPTLMQQRAFFAVFEATGQHGHAALRHAYGDKRPDLFANRPLQETDGAYVRSARTARWLCVTVLAASAGALGSKTIDHVWKEVVKPPTVHVSPLEPAPVSANPVVLDPRVVEPLPAPPKVVEPTAAPHVTPVTKPVSAEDAARRRGERFSEKN